MPVSDGRHHIVQPRYRTDIVGRSTRYEIVAEIVATGKQIRLGFLARINARELMRLAIDAPDADRAEFLAGIVESDVSTYSAARGWEFGGKLRVGKSGRTERDCADLAGRYSRGAI